MLNWRSTTEALLNGARVPDHNLKFLKQHLEKAVVLDIGEPEQNLLKNLVEYSSHWHSIASKILASRQLAKLDLPDLSKPLVLMNADEEMKGDIDLQELPKIVYPERYCICRRPDDGMHFMIECDTCNEWFHGFCVGLTEEESS